MVKNRLENVIENKQLLTKQDMELLIEYFVNQYKLNKEVRDVDFITNYGTYYDTDYDKINLNYNQLKEYATYNFKCFEKDPELFYFFSNYELVYYLLHEIMHAKQINIIRNNQGLLKDIYEDSYNYINEFYNIYRKKHDEFLLEYNANVEGLIECYKFMISLENCLGYDIYSIYNLINEGYYKKKKNIISLIENESIMINEPFHYKKLISNSDYKNMNNLDKILNGLPIDLENYNKIEQIKEMKTLKLERLFK